jgi:phosphate/phosphite/phosphonate ABC transporter binding protein
MCAGITFFVVVACARKTTPDQPVTAEPPAPTHEGDTEKPAVLRVGLTPVLPQPKLEREFGPLVQYLGEQLGIDTEIVLPDSYGQMSQLISRQEIHMAVLSPFAYVVAKQDNPELTLLASHIANGLPTYHGYIVARDDSDFVSVRDLRGKRFAFVDRHSASGYLYPMAYLRASDIDPQVFFSSVSFAGNHEKVVAQILAGELDAGAVASPIFRMARAELVGVTRLRILAKTGRIPFDAYCTRPGLPPEMVDQIRTSLLSLSTRTERGRRILSGLSAINGFVAVGDKHYDEIRRLARVIGDDAASVP